MRLNLRPLWTVLFGSVTFSENDEYEAFKYKFLIVLLSSGAVLTGLFVLGNLSSVNPIVGMHSKVMVVFTGLALSLWWTLRSHPERFAWVAWSYEAICLLEYTSSLAFVRFDELRVLWFFINVPGVFILLGQRAGWAITAASMAGLMVGNRWLEEPYSGNAMATAVLGLLYLGLIFHVYVDRSISYFVRMRNYNLELQRLASHAPLTGVMNARAYYAACEQAIRLCQRQRQPFAVLFVDLDHFKRINDTHGHAVGDEVLRTVASTLMNTVRGSDLVGRIGGEEFSIFLSASDEEGAARLAETLRQAIEACRPAAGPERMTVTASIGVAVSRDVDATMQAIQERADEAMYRAKQGGRNRVSMLTASAGA